MTLLSTRSTLFLLEENHQWQVQPSLDEDHEAETPARSNIQLKEKQPITSISSIITYRLCPCDIKLMLYDEVTRSGNGVSMLGADCGQILFLQE